MRWFQISCFTFLSLICLSPVSAKSPDIKQHTYYSNLLLSSPKFDQPDYYESFVHFDSRFHLVPSFEDTTDIVKTPNDGGIREEIPDKFQARYQRWKSELLTSDYGQQLWNRYAVNKSFILTITVSRQKGQGAGSGVYKWNEDGELVEATITLGSNLEKGFPDPIYFPVMNSLSDFNKTYEISGNIVAAAKFAHEFGHVNSTVKTSSKVFRLQNKLIPTYNKILLENGYNIQDERLLDLAKQMGGTPVEIWTNREYGGEANTMQYLLSRLNKEDFYCSVINKIESNIKDFAHGFESHFNRIAENQTSKPCY